MIYDECCPRAHLCVRECLDHVGAVVPVLRGRAGQRDVPHRPELLQLLPALFRQSDRGVHPQLSVAQLHHSHPGDGLLPNEGNSCKAEKHERFLSSSVPSVLSVVMCARVLD